MRRPRKFGWPLSPWGMAWAGALVAAGLAALVLTALYPAP